MLATIHIENIAVIKTVDVDFSTGFSAFTGETGAGKSILIDSINLLLGNRADRELIRKGEERALVSAIFESVSLEIQAALAQLGVETDEDGCIMIQRTVTREGHSSVRINGRSSTLSLLREVGALLIHIHGQNDNRLLTEPQNYIRILDSYADNKSAYEIYVENYKRLCHIRRQIKEINGDESARLRMVEMLRYQIADIDQYNLKADEEEALEEKRLRLRNTEKISKQTSFAYRALKGSEKGSVTYILSRSISALEQLTDVLPQTEQTSKKLEDIMWQIDDIAEQIYELGGKTEEDPTTMLNKVEERLDIIAKLCRKYGKDIAAILEFRRHAAEQLNALISADEHISELEQAEKECIQATLQAATTLHNSRALAAERLQKEITEALTFLDMPRVRFVIQVEPNYDKDEPVFDAYGNDNISFLIATNAGEVPAPMAKIASGGELSRIMLSLKSVIADNDGIPTIVYDEIDTGVSGKTARKIGIKLKESARKSQILCVTHSAQIASLADSHFVIRKQEQEGRANTSVAILADDERVEELARILGGLSVTDAQRQAARDMLAGN